MFDGIEFGAVRRIVHDEELHANPIRKIYKVLFDNMVSAGIRSTTIAEDDERLCVRIKALQVVCPDPLDVVAYELGGVVACAEGEVSRVVCNVVDAVGYNRPGREGREVMVESLWGRRAIDLPQTLEVSDQFLLLGVYADDRNPRFQADLFCCGNLFKLRVPVPRFVQRQTLKKRPFLEACVPDQQPYDIIGNHDPSRNELVANLWNAESEPDDILVLRKSGHVLGNDFVKCGHNLGMLVNFPFCSATRHSLFAVRWGCFIRKFTNCLGNSIWRTFESLAYSLDRTAVDPGRLACNKKPSIAFFKCAEVHYFRLRNFYWRFFLHSCNDLKINYKDTKIPPVIHYSIC